MELLSFGHILRAQLCVHNDSFLLGLAIVVVGVIEMKIRSSVFCVDFVSAIVSLVH